MRLSVAVSGKYIEKAYSLCPLISAPASNSATISDSEKIVFDWLVGAPFLGAEAAAAAYSGFWIVCLLP